MSKEFIHPYMPNSVPEIKQGMLDELGITSVEELYGERISGQLRYTGTMNLPEPILDEYRLKKHVTDLLDKNVTCDQYSSFLGAGCYNHYVPAVCDEINSRGEFLTGYCGDTYSDHGKMQAIFEYTSMMGELLDLDVVTYTNYDGGQAVNSALRTCLRVHEAQGQSERCQVLYPATMNPEILSQMKEYCQLVAELIPVAYHPGNGLMDLNDLQSKLASGKVSAVFYENPSYLGFFETQTREIAEAAHAAGALVTVQPDLASLGVIESPANYGADVVCGDIQPLGMHIQYGGGCAGFIACRNIPELIEQLPTYLYGICKTDAEGQYGWGRALNYRCSHGSREKAREYFGTETGLWGITAGVYLALMGPQGMKELGEHILQKCAYAVKALSGIPGLKSNLFGNANFQEFVVNFDGSGKTVAQINEELLAQGIFGGKDLSRDFPALGRSALYAVTEKTSQEQIDALAAALKNILGGANMGKIRTHRDFQEARWDEPIIMEMGRKGQRGIFVSPVEEACQSDVSSLIPAGLARRNPPKLPELSQMEVVRHYTRLSQETIGTDINIDIGLGTCTMKYSPKVNEAIIRSPRLQELHPFQDDSTVQGLLEIMYNTCEYLKEISGLDCFTIQPSGGTQAIYNNVATIRAYHHSRGEGEQRNEIITTILSHPGNPGAAATAGYKVITLMPNAEGYPDIEALKAVVGPHTAALMITNPEDTGLYNPRIKEFTDIVHSVGGLCSYDQANLNGVFCLTRAKEAGFDLCHYNLHKSFSSPHGCQGPGAGASGCVEKLAKFQPVPRVCYDGKKYYLDYNYPESIGKLRKFFGMPAVIVRSYAYIRSMGQQGLKNVAELSILNNNYMLKKMLEIKGLSMPLAPGVPRLEQARLSWQELTEETGVTTDDICRRIVDYGFQDYFASHHPRVIPEPFTPEPCETYSLDDIEEYVAAFKSIAEECYNDPQLVKSAPHRAALSHQIDEAWLTDMDKLATTWRTFLKIKDSDR